LNDDRLDQSSPIDIDRERERERESESERERVSEREETLREKRLGIYIVYSNSYAV